MKRFQSLVIVILAILALFVGKGGAGGTRAALGAGRGQGVLPRNKQ